MATESQMLLFYLLREGEKIEELPLIRFWFIACPSPDEEEPHICNVDSQKCVQRRPRISIAFAEDLETERQCTRH